MLELSAATRPRQGCQSEPDGAAQQRMGDPGPDTRPVRSLHPQGRCLGSRVGPRDLRDRHGPPDRPADHLAAIPRIEIGCEHDFTRAPVAPLGGTAHSEEGSSRKQWKTRATAGSAPVDDRTRPDEFVHVAPSHLSASKLFNLTVDIFGNRNMPRIGICRMFYLRRPPKWWCSTTAIAPGVSGPDRRAAYRRSIRPPGGLPG